MQDLPYEGAEYTVRDAIDVILDDPLAYDHIWLRLEEDSVSVKLSVWPQRDKTRQTRDDRIAAIKRFEREMDADTNKSVWLEIFPCSIEVGYRDVTGREVTISKEYERMYSKDDDSDVPESITECA